ncbi:MAG: energy transducer TonB [Hyphomonadaceae bacterium]|nr:energy transducer TonB [Hyphomonadaceae bacterium]MBC6411529.1 energy transducer TonB [Hyphomonadaceae bacterium]
MFAFVRLSLSAIVAAVVTFGLFTLMTILIAGEFKAGEKSVAANFEINPQVDDVKVIRRETKFQKVKKVVTPPPPPQIERQQAAKPTEPIATLEGAIPEFEAPKIDRQNFKIQVSDRDAQPLVRIPPVMPPRAEKSGRCKVRFDVSPEGAPFNVVVTYCSQSLFERASIKSVQKWKYNPKIVDGRPVARSGVETTITFRLTDERGNIIPE